MKGTTKRPEGADKSSPAPPPPGTMEPEPVDKTLAPGEGDVTKPPREEGSTPPAPSGGQVPDKPQPGDNQDPPTDGEIEKGKKWKNRIDELKKMRKLAKGSKGQIRPQEQGDKKSGKPEFGRKAKGKAKKSKGDKLFGELFRLSTFLRNELHLYTKSMSNLFFSQYIISIHFLIH